MSRPGCIVPPPYLTRPNGAVLGKVSAPFVPGRFLGNPTVGPCLDHSIPRRYTFCPGSYFISSSLYARSVQRTHPDILTSSHPHILTTCLPRLPPPVEGLDSVDLLLSVCMPAAPPYRSVLPSPSPGIYTGLTFKLSFFQTRLPVKISTRPGSRSPACLVRRKTSYLSIANKHPSVDLSLAVCPCSFFLVFLFYSIKSFFLLAAFHFSLFSSLGLNQPYCVPAVSRA